MRATRGLGLGVHIPGLTGEKRIVLRRREGRTGSIPIVFLPSHQGRVKGDADARMACR